MQNVLITKKQLEAAGYTHPQIFQHALTLLIKVTGTSAQHVLTNKNPLTPKQQEELDKLIHELTALHKPLAYVVGNVPFGDLTIITQSPTLIPRPETEEWVHELIKLIREHTSIQFHSEIRTSFDKLRMNGEKSPLAPNLNPPTPRPFDFAKDRLRLTASPDRLTSPHPIILSLSKDVPKSVEEPKNASPFTILDLCTGSGCIALTLAKAFPTAQVIGSDIATTALKLAQKNRELNNIKNCYFIQSNLFEKITQKFDIIVANPPYVAENEWSGLAPEITNWEDKKALVADNNGLALTQQIIAQAPRFFKKSGILVLEMGYRQASALYTFAQSCGYTDIQVKKDFEGNDRVLMGQYEVVKYPTRE